MLPINTISRHFLLTASLSQVLCLCHPHITWVWPERLESFQRSRFTSLPSDSNEASASTLMKLISSSLVLLLFFMTAFSEARTALEDKLGFHTGIHQVDFSVPKPAIVYWEPYNLKHLKISEYPLLCIWIPFRLVLHDYYVVGQGKSGHLEVMERGPCNIVHEEEGSAFLQTEFIFRRAWSAYTRVSSSKCNIFCRFHLQITFEKTLKALMKAVPNEVSNGT